MSGEKHRDPEDGGVKKIVPKEELMTLLFLFVLFLSLLLVMEEASSGLVPRVAVLSRNRYLGQGRI